MIKSTHTCAILELSSDAFNEIYIKLKEAGYEHTFNQEKSDKDLWIDMSGIGIKLEKDATTKP